ncbi:MAG: PTS sugar transporter subunit IIA [Proteobacteria bacterium]|jgi:PTS system ascorbate-specific IIA component|nr:PTS sugar transporter subunit IIA [Pseudomonadota bacterium]
MIGVLVIAHGPLGASLADALAHVLGAPPAQFAVIEFAPGDDPADALPKARAALAGVDSGDGVLVLCDLYGASPCNLAMKLAAPGRVEVVAGVNLPMLVRSFTYRSEKMDVLVRKAVSGGCDGVMHIPNPAHHAAARG